MSFFRYEIADQATFTLGEQIFPTLCHHIRLQHIAGFGDAEITFAASGATAQVILSPAGGSYPREVQMASIEGFDRVRIRALGGPPVDATVEVTAWT